ncbi:hypothetical protein D3C81_1270970 [compost metagenome]
MLAYLLELLRVGLGQLGELLREGIDLVVLQRGDAGQLRRQRLLEAQHLLGRLVAVAARRLGYVGTDLTLHALHAARAFDAQFGKLTGQLGAGRGGLLAQQHDHQQDDREQRHGQRQVRNQGHAATG